MLQKLTRLFKSVSESSFAHSNVLELVDDSNHFDLALGPDLSYLTFFQVSPFSVLAAFVLLEELVELSEQVRVDVSEEPPNIFNCERVKVVLKGRSELVNFCIIALETSLQDLVAVQCELLELLKVRIADLRPKIWVELIDRPIDDLFEPILCCLDGKHLKFVHLLLTRIVNKCPKLHA